MRRNAYYKSCPECGANLDPGEHCDCDKDPANGDDTSSLCVTRQLSDGDREVVAFYFGEEAERIHREVCGGCDIFMTSRKLHTL